MGSNYSVVKKLLNGFEQLKIIFVKYIKLINIKNYINIIGLGIKSIYNMFIIINQLLIIYFGIQSKLLTNFFFDSVKIAEIGSILGLLFFGILFYYFIIIELSIYLFGYSLLIYGYSFIVFFVFLFFLWGTEVNIIKRLLESPIINIKKILYDYDDFSYVADGVDFDQIDNLKFWVLYYNGGIPFSFVDFIFRYTLKKEFHHFIISVYGTELGYFGIDSFLLLGSFFLLLMYLISYNFNPGYVNFISKYFFSFIQFLDQGQIIGGPDFFNFLVNSGLGVADTVSDDLENRNKVSVFILKELDKLPNIHHGVVNLNKMYNGRRDSIKVQPNYGDIMFLGAVYSNVVGFGTINFSTEEPMVFATDLSPNMPFFFSGFLGNSFDNSNGFFFTKNLWLKNFYNDEIFWEFMLSYKPKFIEKINLSSANERNSLENEGKFYSSFYESRFLGTFVNENNFPHYLGNFGNTTGVNRDFFEFFFFYDSILGNHSYENQFGYDLFVDSIVPGGMDSLFKLFGSLKIKNSIISNLTDGFDEFYIFQQDNYEFLKGTNNNFFEEYNFFGKKKENFTPLYSYKNITTINTPTYKLFDQFYGGGTKKSEFKILVAYLDERLTNLEGKLGWGPYIFTKGDWNWMSWFYLRILIMGGIRGLEVGNNEINWEDQLAISQPTFGELYTLIEGLYGKSSKTVRNFFKNGSVKVNKIKKIYGPNFSKSLRISFYKLELGLRKLEMEILNGEEALVALPLVEKDLKKNLNKYDFDVLGPSNFQKGQKKLFEETTNHLVLPWYLGTMNYLAPRDLSKFLKPGFVGFYYPTPFPSAFSSIGLIWMKFQVFQKNTSLTPTTTTPVFSGDSNYYGPIIFLGGAEIFVYLEFFIKIIRETTKLFLGLCTYPIEFITYVFESYPFSQFFIQNDSIGFIPVIILFNLLWFLYFYIYVFLFAFIFFGLYSYYFKHVTFNWFYEKLINTKFLLQQTNLIYWHTLADLWGEYKTPEQLFFLNIQSLLLLQYSFSSFFEYFVVGSNLSTLSVVTIFFDFLGMPKNDLTDLNLLNYMIFKNHILNSNINKGFETSIFLLLSFFGIYLIKYTSLLYEGGSDCNKDVLLWNYYDYLTQVSKYLLKGISKYFFFKNKQNLFELELESFIKQFTVILASNSLKIQLFFCSTPLLDTILSGKFLSYFFLLIDKNYNFFFKYLFSSKFLNSEKKNLLFFLWCEQKFNLSNFYSVSGMQFYQISTTFNLSSSITKTNTCSFWNSIEFWIFVFFGSFGFISKTGYPFINFNGTHEHTGLQLAGNAYANSWIGYSMYSGPFYNLVQHLWWTSLSYGKFDRLFYGSNLNFSSRYKNIILDQVGNFFEKGYYVSNFTKSETIFGFVGTLHFPVVLDFDQYNQFSKITNYQNNFFTTYSNSLLENLTTNGGYDKTNPPLNIFELGITPGKLINLFGNCPIYYLKFYLTFLGQLKYFSSLDQTLELNELLEFYKILENRDSENFLNELLPGYDGYLKKFDNLLSYNNSTKGIFANWVFGFDVSFFFSHFTTWDFFSTNYDSVGPKHFEHMGLEKFKGSDFLNKYAVLENMSYPLKTEVKFLKKPFGVVDKTELFALGGYQIVKSFDLNATGGTLIDPFLNPDGEYLSSLIGISANETVDKGETKHIYNELYAGFGKGGFPLTNNLYGNVITPVIIGWVGELYNVTQHVLSFIFSLQFFTSKIHPESLFFKNKLVLKNEILAFQEYDIATFFSNTKIQNGLLIKSFSWLNYFLHPGTFRYSYGPKAAARLDYLSWKAKFFIDYGNGFFSARPYLGLRHTFAASILPYDSVSGFYGTYGQFNDNIWKVDFATEAEHNLFPTIEEYREQKSFLESTKEIETTEEFLHGEGEIAAILGTDESINDEDEGPTPEQFIRQQKFLNQDDTVLNGGQGISKLLIAYYGELYYSFHHPFFLGYFVFWFLLLISKQYYLGLVNFSFGGFVLVRILKTSMVLNKYLNFNDFFFEGKNIENTYGKTMSGYRIYWTNPIKLTNSVATLIQAENDYFLGNRKNEIINYLEFDQIKNDLIDWGQGFYHFYVYIYKYIKFFNGLNLNENNLGYFIDCQGSEFLLLSTNWLNLDFPFSLHPYLLIPNSKSYFLDFNLDKFFNLAHFGFSTYDSLSESVNLNLFFDWSSGVFLNKLNFTNYSIMFQSINGLPNEFVDEPDYFSSGLLIEINSLPDITSFDVAGFVKTDMLLAEGGYAFYSYDILFSDGFLLHTLSLVKFFSDLLPTILLKQMNTFSDDRFFFFKKINLFLNKSYLNKINFYFFKGSFHYTIGTKISAHLKYNFSGIQNMFFIYGLIGVFAYDEIMFWFTFGTFFKIGNNVHGLFLNIGFSLFIGYFYINRFVKKYGVWIIGFF